MSKKPRTTDRNKTGDILKYGELLTSDEIINECNLFWAKDRDSIECFYQKNSGEDLKKLTKSMCSVLWNLKKPHLLTRFNDQVLPNGIHVVPVVSPAYCCIQPTREQCAAKIVKKAIPILNTTLRLYNFELARRSVLPASRIVIPADALTRRKRLCRKKNKKRVRDKEETRLKITQFCEQLRTTAAVAHMDELNDNMIANAASLSEFVNLSVECGENSGSNDSSDSSNNKTINITKYLICLYHILFPLDDERCLE